MNKIKTSFFLAIIIILITWLIITLISRNENCQGNDFFKNSSFYGVVTRKYIDSEQHSIPVIEILDLDNKKTIKVDFFLDISHSYEKIHVSDSIMKKKGNMDIYLLNNGKSNFLTKVDFSCQ